MIVLDACLDCGKKLDGVQSLSGKSKPQAGDVTVCFHCGHIMVFADDGGLRNPTSREMYDIAGDKRIIALQMARKYMKVG